MSKPKMYISDNVLEESYLDMDEAEEAKLRRYHIRRSDVFYVRQKIFLDTCVQYVLDHVERGRFIERLLEEQNVVKPSDKRREYGFRSR